jgi:hypothetical protein
MPEQTNVTRRELLSGTAAGSLALATLGAVRPNGADAQTSGRAPLKPNILFILADDLGYADLSCYGRRDLSTPNIDHIAADGIRFMQAYANSAVCTASRVALITGRYQYRLAVGLEEPLTRRNVGLPPQHSTLPSILEKGRLPVDPDRQVAFGQAARFRPTAERLRSFLRFPRRRA